MFLYRLQNRNLKYLDGTPPFHLPSKVIIEATLSPDAAFGVGAEHSRLALRAVAADIRMNMNNGRMRILSNPHLEPIKLEYIGKDETWSLDGTLLRLEYNCDDIDDLQKCLSAVIHTIPFYLNLILADPPLVKHLACYVGDCHYRVEFEETSYEFRTTTPEDLRKGIVNVLQHCDCSYNRLSAALAYMHTASRLLVAGDSDFEFMPESILNMCKSLQTLFGNNMDSVREGLRNLGYSEETIEGDYIPLMVLRNHFDVGHNLFAIPNTTQLQTLYKYLIKAENRMKDMLLKVFEKYTDSSLNIPVDIDPKLSSEKQKQFDRLIETISKRIVSES